MNDSFKRAMRMLRMVGQSQGLSAGELVSRLASEGVRSTEKRVRETLRKIQDAGIGIWEDMEDRTPSGASRWKLHVGVKIGEALQLNRNELLALYLSRQSLMPLKETAIFRDFESAFQKIDRVLGRPELRELQSLGEEVHYSQFHGQLLNLNSEVVDAVHSACSEGHILECDYFSPERQVVEKRRFGPHFLTFQGGVLYLFAEDLATGKSKTFSLMRMKSARMLEEPYESSRISFQEAFGREIGIVRGDGAIETVRIRFRPGGPSTYVRERLWHPSQQIVPLPDGGVELQLKVSVSPWLVKWILGFEKEAEVVEPASLRNRLIASAQSVLSVYGANKKAA